MAARLFNVKTGAIAQVLFALVFFGVSAVSASEPKRILLVHSFIQDFSPWLEYENHIRAELRRQLPEPLEIFEFSLASARLADEGLDNTFTAYLGALSARYKIDLVVTIGAPAANFFLKIRQQVFPDVPMIFTGVEQRRLSLFDLTANDTVVPSAVDHVAIIDHILHLLPATDHVAVVTGNSPNEKYWVEAIRDELKPFAGRVTFTWLNELSFEGMLKQVATLPPRSAILFIYVSVDAAGVSHEGRRSLARLHSVANAPMFSWIDIDFGQGIVGGPLVSLVEVARQVSRTADRILRGEVPSKIGSQPVGLGRPKYDWREMRRWGISEASLPPGGTIYFREQTVWERYWGAILLIFAALLFQGGLIGWLIYEHRRRHLAEVQSRSAMSDLVYMNRLAAAAQLSATLSHEVNQPLTGIMTRASAGLNWLRREKPDLEKAGAALQSIVGAAQRARDIVSSVRGMFKKESGERTRVDLNDTILTVLAIVRIDIQASGVNLQLGLQDDLPVVMGNRVQLQQVVLNLVMNAIEAMRSGQPRVLRLQTGQSKPGLVHMLVGDTGPGIAASNLDQVFKPLFTTKSRGMGMGLAICRSIIESHGGRIWVSPEATRGAVFHVELPIKE